MIMNMVAAPDRCSTACTRVLIDVGGWKVTVQRLFFLVFCVEESQFRYGLIMVSGLSSVPDVDKAFTPDLSVPLLSVIRSP